MSRRRRGRGKSGGESGGEAEADKAVAREARGGGTRVNLTAPPAGQPVLGSPDEWFGPGRGMRPIAPRNTAGRRFDFNFGANLQVTPRWDQRMSFADLRFLADSYDLVRLAIETRKDQMARQQFTFGLVDSDDDLSADQEARAKRYRMLLRRPDGENFWPDWLRMVLEDLLVIDAPSIFIQRTMDREDILGLYQIDGATIKPIIDNLGRTPQPPEAAFQQVLHGMPAVDYTTRELVYRPRNRRVHTVWGFSPVEQIVVTVNIALRRQAWQHAYFTNGNIPDSLIGVPTTWSPDQIRDFQDWFDGFLTGNTDRRRGAIFVPGEVAKSYVPTKEAEIFGKAEEWLARVVCFAFSIPHQALVKEVNRATAETSQEQATDDGLAPIMNWVESLINGILIDHFAEDEIEFRFVTDREMDPKVQDDIWAGRVDRAMADRNEWRAAVGMDARPEPEASKLMASSVNSPTPISVDDAIEAQRTRQESGVFPTPPKPGEEAQRPGGDREPPKPGGDGPPAAAGRDAGKAAGGDVAKAKANRQALYRKLSATRRSVERQRVKLAKVLTKALRDAGKRAGAAVAAQLGVAAKDAADDLNAIIDAALAGVGSWEFLIDPTAAVLEAIAEDTTRIALASLGMDLPDELFDQVSDLAVDAARARAAELVGKRILENGDIVDNPDARWAISDATRDMIRETITRVLGQAEGSRQIVQELEDSHAFSPERADMIARTEVAQANSAAAMESYRAARDAGVNVKKVWEPGAESCDECLANADEGPIDLDDSFSSGDDEPPAHPNCTCAVLPEVVQGESEEESEQADGEPESEEGD